MSIGCTYELTVIRQLFTEFLEASRQAGDDPELAEKVREILPCLEGFRICEDGSLAEWREDYPEADAQHRHTSHLLGLYPFDQITPQETPGLAAAAEKSIEKKLTPYANWEDTGWARSLLLLYEARLLHGEKAGFHLDSMLGSLREPNGMIYHPPTRGTVFDDDFGHVYELDGNTGLSAGICEMLLQSHGGIIRLLPAIPAKWASGHVKGLIARGGICTEFWWADGYVTKALFLSGKEQSCSVEVNGKIRKISLKKGRVFSIKA